MSKRIDDNAIIDDVLSVIKLTNDITFKNYKTNGKYSENTINSHFKNWTNLLKIINITPINNRNISKEDILSDIRKVFNETNNTTQDNYIKYGKYSRAPIKRLFGSWNKLLKNLDIELNLNNDYSKEDILNQFKLACEEENKILTAIEFRKYFSQPIIDNVFGSFSNLKKELDLPIDSRFISDEQILDNMKQLYNEYNEISYIIIDKCSIVSRPTIISRFGSIYEACKLANIPYSIEDNMSMLSKFILSECIKIFGSDYVLEKTFDWLKNPNTNKNLYIDIFYPHLNLAIEVDGEQHYVYKSKFHSSIEDFKCGVLRDSIKNNLLKSNNISLIRIRQNTKRKDIREKLSSFSKG